MSRRARRVSAWAWLRVGFDHDLDPEQARRFLLGVLSSSGLGPVVFETETRDRSVIYRVGTQQRHQVARLFRTHLPTVQLTPAVRQVGGDGRAWVARLNRNDRAFVTSDPEFASAGLLGAIVHGDSLPVIHQMVIGRRLNAQIIPSRAAAVAGESEIARLFNAALVGEQRVDTEARRALVDKQSKPGASVNVRLVCAGDRDHDAVARRYLAGLAALSGVGLRVDLRPEKLSIAASAGATRRTMPLNIDELVALTGWPYGDRSYPGIDRTRSVTRRPQPSGAVDRMIGRSTHPGHQDQPIQLRAVDGLRHTHVLGPTGVGKSTLLLNLILQDIDTGRSVVVIDPKGDLVDDVLARAPDRHLNRIVMIDPSRSDHVVGFNPLAVPRSAEHVAVDAVVHVFKTMHNASWGPRTEGLLHASLLTLVGAEAASIVAIPRLLGDPSYRHEVISQRPRTEPLVAFWRWFDDLSNAERAHITAPLLNKLRPIVLRPQLEAMLSQRDPFRLSRVFDERLVLLVPLRAGAVGPEVAELFGSLLFAQLTQAIQARAATSPNGRQPSFVYADEFQTYTRLPTNFADVLAMARGLGVGLVLAHQNLDQLPTGLRASVHANAQNKILFRLGADDAATMVRQLGDLRPCDFTALPNYEVYAQLLDRGERLPTVSAKTDAPMRPRRNAAVAAEAIVRRWGTPPATKPGNESAGDRLDPSQIGRRRRGEQ